MKCLWRLGQKYGSGVSSGACEDMDRGAGGARLSRSEKRRRGASRRRLRRVVGVLM